MKRKISKIVSLVLILSLMLGVRTSAIGKKAFVNPLEKDENEVRFSTELSGAVAEDIEILSVTVLPHTKSGNVQYNKSDSNSTNEKIGAVVNIFLKNKRRRCFMQRDIFR